MENQDNLLKNPIIEENNNKEKIAQEKIDTIVSLLQKKYPTLTQKNYDFRLFYSGDFSSMIFEYDINNNETILLGFDKIYDGTLEINIASTFKTFSFVDETNNTIIFPMIDNVSFFNERKMDKDFFFEDIVNAFETKIQQISNKTLEEKEELLEMIQLRADIQTAENKFLQKHYKLQTKIIEKQKEKGFVNQAKVVSKEKGYFINKMKVVYSYHDYYKPSISYELGRLRPNGDYNFNIIDSDNFSFTNTMPRKLIQGADMLIHSPNFPDISLMEEKPKKQKKEKK